MNYIAQGATALGILLCVVAPFHASAALLSYGDPAPVLRPASSGVVALPVLLTLDNGECVNAADIKLEVPEASFTYIDHDKSESGFSLWLSETFDKSSNALELIAGTPKPLCGGPLRTTFELAKVVLEQHATGVLDFGRDSVVTLSDGYGSETTISYMPRVLRLAHQ